MSAVQSANVCCPTCLTGGTDNPLMTSQGRFGLFCNAGHLFDSAELAGMNLKKIIPPPKPEKSQLGTQPFAVPLLPDVLNRFKARFGERAEQTAGAILASMADDPAFVVPAEDVLRLSSQYGRPIKSASACVGAMFETRQDLNQKTEMLEKIKAGQPIQSVTGDGIKVKLSPALLEMVTEKATFNSKTVEQYLAEELDRFHTSGWFNQ